MQAVTRRDDPGLGRQALVWQALTDALPSVLPHGSPARVLDCGGGSGRYAVPLAEAGAQVTVVDISADALATLRRRADEAGVSARVQAVQGEVETLGDLVDPAGFDLVLAHGILHAVEAPGATFAVIAQAVRPGGLLSVLVANPVAAVLAHALAGELPPALTALQNLGSSESSASPAEVDRLCAAHGLVVEQAHGIGVFSELVPGRALDAPGAHELLLELEAAGATRRPFRDIAAQIHLLARRAG